MNSVQESWKRFCDGEDSAISDVFDDLVLSLQYESYYYTKSWEQSKDIVGDIFLMLLDSTAEQRSMWRTKRDCAAFLKVVVKFKSIDYVRKMSNYSRLHKLIDWPVLEREKLSDEDLRHYAFSLLNEREQKFLQEILSGVTIPEMAREKLISEKTLRNSLSIIRLKLNRIRMLLIIIFH